MAVIINSVSGKKLKLPGKTTPRLCLNITPSNNAKSAMETLPSIHFPKSFLVEVKKYGNTMIAKSVVDMIIVSSPNAPMFCPKSRAKKNKTNVVSPIGFSDSPSFVFALIAEIASMFRRVLVLNDL